ncbi:hypothetical protein BpHYR1_017122 [Brachionus plicatilis]|uniref:Uncharacterized protein n=1 Tax=Brachionus plicatilis TaxID=10195 RepID=A0A3M7S6D0_BRAPC|nr:hypothetical protein BpHYR1_017122 [Brachionus plicatilis]
MVLKINKLPKLKTYPSIKFNKSLVSMILTLLDIFFYYRNKILYQKHILVHLLKINEKHNKFFLHESTSLSTLKTVSVPLFFISIAIHHRSSSDLEMTTVGLIVTATLRLFAAIPFYEKKMNFIFNLGYFNQ